MEVFDREESVTHVQALAEIGGDHVATRRHLVERALGGDAARYHHVTRRQSRRTTAISWLTMMKVVRRLRFSCIDQFDDRLLDDRVDAGKRLVEHIAAQPG